MTCILLVTRYRWREEVYLYEPLEYEVRRMQLALQLYHRRKLEITQGVRDNGCTKHTWVYFHSERVRRCIDCAAEETLWADFGLNHRTTE